MLISLSGDRPGTLHVQTAAGHMFAYLTLRMDTVRLF
jgi:hypothetical protein